MLSLLFKQAHHTPVSSPGSAGFQPANSPGSAGFQPANPSLEVVKSQPVEPPIVGVLGAKGGVGTTTIAINLASSLIAEFGTSTLLDSNLQQPDAANILGLDVRYSLLDLLARKELTADIVDACCNRITDLPNVKLLTAPTNGQAGLQANLSQVAESLDSMRKFSGSWVLDLPKYLDRHMVTLLDRCSVILIVLEPTLAGAAAARRWLRLLEDLDYPKERTLLVINRSGSKLRTAENEITTALSSMSVVKIPNAYEMAEECTAMAAPVVVKFPKSAYARAIKGLAKQIAAMVSEPIARG
jgi:pilus assembly protein CpaE